MQGRGLDSFNSDEWGGVEGAPVVGCCVRGNELYGYLLL
jgi:hypothetical protein